MKKLITALLCVCILLGVYGCAAKPAAEDPAAQAKPTQTEQTPAADAQTPETSVQDETGDPFGGYDTPITLTTIVAQTLTTSCPEGVTLDDNPWKTLWNSKGIDVQYTSVAADFEDMPTKINLAITAGEFPDFASVSYATYKELLEADMLTDMTDIFEQYASDDLKKLMYADGGVMASNVTKDGRLYGLVQPADYLDKGGVVAIRTDWLQELGLSEPKSMADVWDIAAAFKENNMGGTCTIGLGATKEISDMLAMKYLINAEGGLVSTWLEQDGELVYSLIQPEMKTALSALHDKYASGLLDQEYGTKSEQQLFEDAVSGKSGVVICNMTAPFYLDNGISLGQEWGYYPLYNEDGGFAPVEVSTSIGSVVVVSKDCKNPEAVVKLFNMFISMRCGKGYPQACTAFRNRRRPDGRHPDAAFGQFCRYLQHGVVFTDYDRLDGRERWQQFPFCVFETVAQSGNQGLQMATSAITLFNQFQTGEDGGCHDGTRRCRENVRAGTLHEPFDDGIRCGNESA